MMTRLLHASILFLMVFFSIPLPPEEISQAAQTHLPVIQKLLERCLEIAKTLPNDDEDYDPSIQGYAQDVRSSQARILEDIAITLAMAGNVEAALQTIAAIEDPSWRDPGLLRIVQAQADTGDLAGAKDTAMSTITDISYLNGALSIIGQKHATAGNLESALNVFPDYGYGKAKLLLNLSTAQARAGDAKGALNTYWKAVKNAEQEGNASAFKRDTLEHLMEFQVQTGDLNGALETLEGIPDSRKVFYVGMLAEAQAKLGNNVAALELASRGLRLANATKSESERSYALSQVARTLAIAGDIDNAVKAASSSKLFTDSSLQDIATVQARNRDIRGALQTRSKVRDKAMRIATLQAIAKAQTQLGNIEYAIQTASSLKNSKAKLQALVEIADVPIESPHMLRMLDYMPPITNDKGLALAAQSLATAQARSGGSDEAIKWASNQGSPMIQARVLVGIARGLLEKTGN